MKEVKFGNNYTLNTVSDNMIELSRDDEWLGQVNGTIHAPKQIGDDLWEVKIYIGSMNPDCNTFILSKYEARKVYHFGLENL